MNFECKLVEKISKKSGNPYKVIEITLANGYKKLVFLDSAEMALVNLTYHK